MKKFSLYILCLCLLLLPSCSSRDSMAYKENSIYYWRTTFTLNDAEKEFLKKHNINKLYVRFFDVDKEYEPVNGEYVIPQATIKFIDNVPSDIEIVPTVYITNSAIEKMQLKEDEYAEKIYQRVNAICRSNKIEFNELQLDCDFTKNSRKYFFKLCDEMKQLMPESQSLSSTIRLHQLTQPQPPVDKGVLMVYNTGNLMEMTTDNSIFSYKDIEPYLCDNRLAKYGLPLDVAYPTYGWSVVFYPVDDRYYFSNIMRLTDFSDYPQIEKIKDNLYKVNDNAFFNNDSVAYAYVYKNYLIRVERPTADEILKIKKLIDRQLKGKPHHNILYHLDESQFSHYSDNEINKIYSRN